VNGGHTVTPKSSKVHCNIIVLSVLRCLGLNFLNFDLLFIFGRNSQVKHVHERSKSMCITILNLRILYSMVNRAFPAAYFVGHGNEAVGPLPLSSTMIYPHSLVVVMT